MVIASETESFIYNGKKIILDIQKFPIDDKPIIIDLYESYSKYRENITKYGCRSPNIPEVLSEGIYCLVTGCYRVIKSHTKGIIKSDCYDPLRNKFIQIKASILEKDCSSFGPKSKQDEICYIDLSKLPKFTIYNLNNINIMNTKTNLDQTFEQQQSTGRRPRLSLMDQIKKYHIKPFYVGNIYEIDMNKKILYITKKKNMNK